MSGAKMFVEVLTSEDDDNDAALDSDGEVQYVPYVKPPPPVIDLLVSSDDDTAHGEESSRSQSGKNRKRKKSKNYQTDESAEKLSSDSIGSIPNSDRGPTSETPLLPVSSSAVNVGQSERMLIHAVNTTRAVNDADREPDASLNAESTVLNNNQSSSNVGASCSMSKNDDSVHQTHFLNTEKASLPSIRIASSIFEPNTEVLGEPVSLSSARNGAASVVEPVIVIDTMSGTTAAEVGGDTSSCPVTGVGNTGISQRARGGQWLPADGGGQVRKVAPTKRKRNVNSTNPPPLATTAAGISATTGPPARKRVSKQQRAKQRTNEEINNFLTTLGIFEPNDAISTPKRTRRSRQLDVLTIPPLPFDAQALSLVPPPPVSEPDSDPVIIPITEISRTPVLPVSRAKAVRKARVPAGAPDAVQSKQNTVATVSDTPTSTAPQGGVLPDILLRPSTRVVSMSVDTGILTRAERASLSFSITPFLGPPSTPITSNPINSNETKDPNPRTTIVATPAVQSDLQKTPRTREINVDVQKKPIRTEEKSTTVQQPDPYAFTDNDNESENDVTLPIPSYLPSRWTSGMVKFYDCTSKEDFRLSRALSEMSDNPALWETNERQFSSQKMNKRLRCVNCNQFGHVIWSCKEKRKKRICHLCGKEGHGGSGPDRDRGNNRCPNAVCLNCGRRQHKVSHGCRQCMHTRKPPRCEICETEGHDSPHCPDNWRRFFSTTTLPQDGSLQPFGDKPAYQLYKDCYCSTCGQKGHNFFHCRFRGRTSNEDKYIKQNPRILDELPFRKRIPPPPATSTVVSSNSTEEKIEECSQTLTSGGKQNIVPDNPTPISVEADNDNEIEVLPTGDAKKCMDPECQNIPIPNTFCYEMFIKPKELQLMRKAQEDDKISASMKPNDQLSIIQNRSAIHIYTTDIVQGQVDVLTLIAKLNTEAVKNNAKVNLPEVITLDEDDDDTEVTKPQPLAVALLESEWDLIFPESIKVDGLISQLTERFQVNIYVSKDNLTVTVENGTEENRKIAQNNIVRWLECQAANVKYVMRFEVENLDSNTPPSSWNKKKKKKQKFPGPKSRKFKKRKRLQNNSAAISDLTTNASSNQSRTNSSQQSNPGSGSRETRKHWQKKMHERRDRRNEHRRQIDMPMNMGPSPTSNNNNTRHFNNRQESPFQNGGGVGGRFPNPNYNNNYAPPPDFHPSFINHQQHQQPQGPPPLMGDFISFRYDTPSPRHRGGGGGSGRRHNNRGNNRRSPNPNKIQQDGNGSKNLLRYYNTGTE